MRATLSTILNPKPGFTISFSTTFFFFKKQAKQNTNCDSLWEVGLWIFLLVLFCIFLKRYGFLSRSEKSH